MRFSCARCGQRYSSVDEPRAKTEYRVPCVACGAVVLVKGSDFPALPTTATGPAAAGPGAVSDASGETPLSLALGPMLEPDRAALPRPAVPGHTARPIVPGPRRWLRIGAGGAVALATTGAALLLVLGGPSEARAPVTSPGSTPITSSGVADPGSTHEPSSATRPATSGPAPGTGSAPSSKAPPRPAAPPPTSALAGKRASQPAARRPASVSAQAPAGAMASPPTSAGSSPAAPAPAATAHPLPDHIVTEALAARRPAFESCVRDWIRDNPRAGLSGRRITISLIVNPTGLVTSSGIDDPSLEATTLGVCLRGAASRPFPAFDGEPVQVMVPLRLVE